MKKPTENIKVGDKIKSWLGYEGTVIAIDTDPKNKPVQVSVNGSIQYYHYNQVALQPESKNQ